MGQFRSFKSKINANWTFIVGQLVFQTHSEIAPFDNDGKRFCHSFKSFRPQLSYLKGRLERGDFLFGYSILSQSINLKQLAMVKINRSMHIT